MILAWVEAQADVSEEAELAPLAVKVCEAEEQVLLLLVMWIQALVVGKDSEVTFAQVMIAMMAESTTDVREVLLKVMAEEERTLYGLEMWIRDAMKR